MYPGMAVMASAVMGTDGGSDGGGFNEPVPKPKYPRHYLGIQLEI
jgi:hypothetical protein